MKRATLIAKGEVQRVGYRDEVERIARKLEITGYVENFKPYDVRIVAEGEDERIDQFTARIKINRFPIDVEHIELRAEAYKGEFEYFELKRGAWQDELGERLDTAGRWLYKNIELSERSVALGERSVELAEESVLIGKKMLDKQDMMLDKQDETISELRGVRDDLKSYMEERFERIEREIADIKSKIGVY